MVKNLPASTRDVGLIPGSGRSPREGNGSPAAVFLLGKSTDRGAWRAAVRGVSKRAFRHDLATEQRDQNRKRGTVHLYTVKYI